MTQEDKQLLLKDLCMRIPYRTLVCLNPGAYNKPETCRLTGVHGEEVHLNVDSDPFRVDHIKPYLRPMSSMTEEEENEFISLNSVPPTFWLPNHTRMSWYSNATMIDWLLAHHFDFRGLIEKGLALEALPGMYD